ncbi:hypothetical protein AB0I54_28440 [Streptomyces sp. NPDC050625]|uniref:hypothetical protein n=1 Tax=Streptomyces sp. NPDC050625 TaxID=3154629 RepID=UPI00341953A4
MRQFLTDIYGRADVRAMTSVRDGCPEPEQAKSQQSCGSCISEPAGRLCALRFTSEKGDQRSGCVHGLEIFDSVGLGTGVRGWSTHEEFLRRYGWCCSASAGGDLVIVRSERLRTQL